MTPRRFRSPRFCCPRGPAEFRASSRVGVRSPLVRPASRPGDTERRVRRGTRCLGSASSAKVSGAVDGRSSGGSRAGFGPRLPWQPLAWAGAPRPPAAGRERAGSPRCAPGGRNQAPRRRGEGPPGAPGVPQPGGLPWEAAPVLWRKEHTLHSGPERRLARAWGRGESGAPRLLPPSGRPRVPVCRLDIFHSTAADLEPSGTAQP